MFHQAVKKLGIYHNVKIWSLSCITRAML